MSQPPHYPFGDTLPAPGTAMTVAEGVKWLRMPLPFALDHINLYLLRDGPGWAIVDCGVATDATRDLWEQVFASALDGRPVTRVIVTHFHPDHLGLAGWLTRRWQVPLLMTQTEWVYGRYMAGPAGSGPWTAEEEQFYGQAGLAEATLAGLRGRGRHFARLVPEVPGRYLRIPRHGTLAIDGRPWQVITGEGHSPEHACLYSRDAGVLLSGDIVLPKISPNVSVWPTDPESDPLSLYLACLDGFAGLAEDTLVLPSHNRPFRGLSGRIAALKAHHAERLAEVAAACASPRTAAEVMAVLFRRPLDLHQTAFAIGETLSHLNALIGGGRIRRQLRPGMADLYVAAA